MEWNDFFMQLCDAVSLKSKDNSTKVGAVIVSADNAVRTIGFNGFPRGIQDQIDKVAERYERPAKYKWTEHAERNAIYNAARMGTSLEGCKIYINSLPPCCDCARSIIQAGLVEVIITDAPVPEHWKEDCDLALEMLKEANVKVTRIKKGE